LRNKGQEIAVFERGERVGRKLSATGNGQGNITNLAVTSTPYFSSCEMGEKRAEELICRFDDKVLTDFFASLGVLLLPDNKGRVYPSGKQASSLTDALRFTLAQSGVQLHTGAQVLRIEWQNGVFCLFVREGEEEKKYYAENVALCTGGKAAKNFGTDGTAYALAQRFGHTVTALYPSLVQLKTDVKYTKTLKGIRVADGKLTACIGKDSVTVQGDILFTDYGISGDAAFRVSAFIADKIQTENVRLSMDFLPDVDEGALYDTLCKKRKAYAQLSTEELLFGIVNNQVGRAVMRRANGDLKEAARLIKAFDVAVTGTLGFDYAQVTKGGVPMKEVDDNLQSVYQKNLYFAGEILDIDGQCGGFNLQWAFASANAVATAILQKCEGQV
jgi:predicted Rossmann fold flavoprotein